METKTYLGDSVYAEFDGYGITLTTNNSHHDDPRNTIFLEPEVLHALNEFVRQIHQRSESEAAS